MEVQILSKKLIKPSVPTPNHLRNTKLSFIDQLPPSIYIPFILYYPANHSNFNTKNVKLQLEKSLSEILTLFYPLAGRLDNENPWVNCNDEGVEFVEAQVDGQLSRILAGEFETELLNKFLPSYVQSATSPLLRVQINMFKCRGLAIGMCLSHRIADGFALSTFINAWAKSSYRGGVNEINSPSFELGVVFPARDLSKSKIPPPCPVKTGLEIVTKRFVFDAKAIKRLKAEAESASACGVKRRVTRVEVVTALMWMAHISALRAKHGRLRDFLLLLPVNLRGKTVPKVSETCYGNVFKFTGARFSADESKMKLPNFVDLVRDAYGKLPEVECVKAKKDFSDDVFFSSVIDSCKKYYEEFYKEEVDVCMYSICCRLPIYVDFGWGKPAWVSGIQMNFETIILLDNKEGDGIEVWVSLDENNMSHFLQDPYSKGFNLHPKL